MKIRRHRTLPSLPSPTIFDCCVVSTSSQAPIASSNTPNTSNHHWRAGIIILVASPLCCLAHRVRLAPSASSRRPSFFVHVAPSSSQCHSPHSGWLGKMMGLLPILQPTQRKMCRLANATPKAPIHRPTYANAPPPTSEPMHRPSYATQKGAPPTNNRVHLLQQKQKQNQNQPWMRPKQKI